MPVLRIDMSELDMDARPRMKDYLKPEDLSTEGCVRLATRILTDASEAYIQAKRHLDQDPANNDAIEHYRLSREFYNREFFAALSMGAMSPRTTVKELDRIARGNSKAGGRKWHGTAM